MRLFSTQTLSKCITVRNSEKNWEKFPGVGVLKSLKKTYKGIGILPEGVLEVKSFTRILLNLKVVSHHIFSSSEIFIFEQMLSVAASELYYHIRNLRHQISGFMSENFFNQSYSSLTDVRSQ